MKNKKTWATAGRVAVFAGALVLMAIILLIDIKTSLWQEVVVLAGLAASVVTFLLTYLVVNRIHGRVVERRWARVTRMALTDLLHGLADEEQSELSRGVVVLRSLPVPQASGDDAHLKEQLDALLHQVVSERRLLAERLGIWSEFLASSGNNDAIMQAVADVSLQLDAVRDTVVEAEKHSPTAPLTEVHAAVNQCNEHLTGLAAAIEDRLRQHADEALQQ
jgi:hypothetical protein